MELRSLSGCSTRRTSLLTRGSSISSSASPALSLQSSSSPGPGLMNGRESLPACAPIGDIPEGFTGRFVPGNVDHLIAGQSRIKSTPVDSGMRQEERGRGLCRGFECRPPRGGKGCRYKYRQERSFSKDQAIRQYYHHNAVFKSKIISIHLNNIP